MKIVWRKILSPETLGIETFEEGDRVKLKNPCPPYEMMGEIWNESKGKWEGSPLQMKGYKEGEEMRVISITPYDSRLFASDDFYVVEASSGAKIKLQRVYLDYVG